MSEARRSIAVVEDELIVALDIRTILERLGYRVVGTFPSGDELLERFAEIKPELVLMDIRIRGSRDGVETAKVVHDLWHIPVILLTAYADDATVARAKLTEPFGYILKPFEERELKTAIELAFYRSDMEAKLRASEERYRRLFLEGISANVLAREDGSILEANEAFRRLFKIGTSESLPPFSVCFPDHAAWESFRAGLRQRKRIEGAELSLKAADGGEVLVLVNAGLLGDEGPFLAELMDTTDMRRLEGQLIQSQKMEAIGRLAGGIAHDFNNILTAIIGYATLLSEELKPQPRLQDDVEGIRKAAAKATELTRQLLAFSRRQPASPRALELDALVRDMEKMLRRLLTERIRLTMKPETPGLKIMADPSQVEQVLLNLVVNARDAMPEGGTIQVFTGLHASPVPVSLAGGILNSGEYLSLTVRDTGTGVPQEIQGRIFEPFFSTKPKDQGTGLGLSTVYGIVRQCGGGIGLESQKGRGASFTVYLPLLREHVEADTGGNQAARGPAKRSRSGRILFVDDDEAVRILAQRLLERSGYEVYLAANAGEALLIAESQNKALDLLVSDVVMPLMDGYSLLKRLKPGIPRLKALFLSGYPEQSPEAEQLGRFLLKPFSEDALLEAVDQALLDSRTE